MTVRWRKKARRNVLKYEQAEAIHPDPLRRATTLLVAASIVLSGLVIADAIRYAILPRKVEAEPLLTALVDLDGNLEDKDRGDQKVEKVKEPEPENQPEPEKEPEPDPKPLVPEPEKEPEIEPVAKPGNDDKGIRIIGREGPSQSKGSSYANRGSDVRAKALGKFGGDAKTESAVRLGLEWLARHQNEDGSWSRTRFNKHCKDRRKCDGAGGWDVPLDVSMTSLAMLCFQAADSTHKAGKYKDNVALAAEYLIKVQKKNGLFLQPSRQNNHYMMYNQGIATFALAELCAMTKDPRLQKHVELAVGFICRAQQPTSGAWDYTDTKTGRYDTSATGWQVMALKSAQAAGVEIPSITLYRVAAFISHVTTPSGEVIYSNMAPAPGRKGPGMTAVGLASCQFLGFTNDDPVRKRQVAYLLENKPVWKKLQDPSSLNSIYYWYYATIAMFQYGGKEWTRWNGMMKKTLLDHQRRGGCLNGSWDPPNNFWGKIGGRMYATTLNVLNLEIYYRYLPLYQSGTIDTTKALLDVAHGKRRVDAVQAIRLLARMDNEVARAALLKLAHHDNPEFAMAAAVALAKRKDAGAVAPLLKQLESDNQFIRYRALRAMRPMIGKGLAPIFIRALSDRHPMVRGQARDGLRQFAALSFGYQAEGSERERKQAIAKWQAWWAKRQKGEIVTEGFAPWLVVRVAADKGLVAFSTGKENAAAKGRDYSIYRNDRYIGKIQVLGVSGQLCVGRIDTTATAGPIQEGDVVKPGT
jgi:HEAT repeat protein